MLTERMVIGQAILTEMVHHLLPIKVDPGEVFINNNVLLNFVCICRLKNQ